MTVAAPPVPLSSLRRGERGTVVGLTGDLEPSTCRRLADLGFTAQTPVECLRRAPLGSPVVYCIGESELCLRADLAGCVLVQRAGTGGAADGRAAASR